MPAPKKAPKAPRTTTAYIVLRLANPAEPLDDDAVPAWHELGKIEAHSDTQAIREWAVLHPEQGGDREVYVAVPQRSFKAQVVQVETQTKLRLDPLP